MLVQSPDPVKKLVDDFDFIFVGGIIRSISVDKEAGDTVDSETHPTAVVIHLMSTPSRTDSSVKLPAEDITIITSQLLFVQHRLREATELTPGQKDEWTKLLKETSISGRVN